MSERKVLNKYYPPDFDPSNIPKMKMARNRTFNIRIMAPCNMRCDTCGEYIYKGKKFNSRKENVEDEFYLGLRIFRFYIKCPKCVSEIAFKTDLKNTDYTLEAGATRLFEAEKLAQQMAERERKEKEEEELNNPMKVLENRTKASRNEIEQIDMLEELREMNAKNVSVNYEKMLEQNMEHERLKQKLQEEEEEREIKAIFGEKDGLSFKRLKEESDGEDDSQPTKKLLLTDKPTDILAEPEVTKPQTKTDRKTESWQRSVGGFSNKKGLMNLVKKKPNASNSTGNKNSEKEDEHSNSVTHKTKRVTNSDAPKSNSSTTAPVSSGLCLLGDYSDSDESD